MVISFIFFLILFVFIGAMSAIKSKRTKKDYLLATQSMSPWLVALSAVSTNNSGYMFIGMIGYTYIVGLSSAWVLIGWVLGDLLMTFFIHKPLRHMTEVRHALSYPEILGRWTGDTFKKFRILASLVTMVFLTIYSAAQFKAGSKALYVLFNWHPIISVLIGASIVLIYCMAGGIRASIWTDVAQSGVMITSMIALAVLGTLHLGGLTSLPILLQEVSPTFISLNPNISLFGSLGLGSIGFIISWVFAGIGVVGQPHIMSRFMTLKDNKSITKARWCYFTWNMLFNTLTIFVGLIARLLIPYSKSLDTELALPILSTTLLPAIGVGFILAGLFSAAMSTADSQILSCTATFIQDLSPNKSSLKGTKRVTAIITLSSALIAIFASSNVFQLVVFAWSALASAFTPIICIRVLNKPLSESKAIAMMFTGLLTVITWHSLGWGSIIYESLPGILSGFIAYLIFPNNVTKNKILKADEISMTITRQIKKELADEKSAPN